MSGVVFEYIDSHTVEIRTVSGNYLYRISNPKKVWYSGDDILIITECVSQKMVLENLNSKTLNVIKSPWKSKFRGLFVL